RRGCRALLGMRRGGEQEDVPGATARDAELHYLADAAGLAVLLAAGPICAATAHCVVGGADHRHGLFGYYRDRFGVVVVVDRCTAAQRGSCRHVEPGCARVNRDSCLGPAGRATRWSDFGGGAQYYCRSRGRQSGGTSKKSLHT